MHCHSLTFTIHFSPMFKTKGLEVLHSIVFGYSSFLRWYILYKRHVVLFISIGAVEGVGSISALPRLDKIISLESYINSLPWQIFCYMKLALSTSLFCHIQCINWCTRCWAFHKKHGGHRLVFLDQYITLHIQLVITRPSKDIQINTYCLKLWAYIFGQYLAK